jgi:hypothetical protein
MEHLLADNSAQTQVEAGDGHFPGVLAQPGQGRLLLSGQLTTFSGIYHAGGFTAVNAGRIFSSWRLVLTWGLAHGGVDKLLPKSLDTLKGITQELLMVGCATGTISNVWSAIEDRSRRFSYPLPLGIEGDFSRMAWTVGSVCGEPSRLIFRSESITSGTFWSSRSLSDATSSSL